MIRLQGDVHVHDMLIGSIMWVSWGEVIRLGIIVVAAGGFHLIFRRRFISLTDSFGDASRDMRRPSCGTSCFIFSFGIVVVEASTWPGS
ncbi:MAG: hypothetical protein R2744_12985 [Bacteroidales bacterium]